jgi:hypothetical protein
LKNVRLEQKKKVRKSYNSRVTYVAKKTLVRLRTFGQFNYVFL